MILILCGFIGTSYLPDDKYKIDIFKYLLEFLWNMGIYIIMRIIWVLIIISPKLGAHE